jgi:hypothetical protein
LGDAVFGSSTGGTTDLDALLSRRSGASAGSRTALADGFSFGLFGALLDVFPFALFSFLAIGGAEDTPSCRPVNRPFSPRRVASDAPARIRR